MKRNTKKLMAVLLCLTLVLSLAACGGGNGTSKTKDPYEIEAEFDPYYLHPGLADGSAATSADVWYPVDSPDSLPMYLTYAADAGYTEGDFLITWIDEEGYDYAYCLAQAEDMELVSLEGEEIEVDFVFSDALTAYDKESKTQYTRAGEMTADELEAYFAGKTFVSQQGTAYTFSEDGTATQLAGGMDYPGTWALTAATVVTFFDEADAAYDVYLQILEDRQGIFLYSSVGNRYLYPEEEAETEAEAEGADDGAEEDVSSEAPQ